MESLKLCLFAPCAPRSRASGTGPVCFFLWPYAIYLRCLNAMKRGRRLSGRPVTDEPPARYRRGLDPSASYPFARLPPTAVPRRPAAPIPIVRGQSAGWCRAAVCRKSAWVMRNAPATSATAMQVHLRAVEGVGAKMRLVSHCGPQRRRPPASGKSRPGRSSARWPGRRSDCSDRDQRQVGDGDVEPDEPAGDHHPRGQDRVTSWAGRAVHQAGRLQVEAERHAEGSVDQEVDPEDLRRA